jgi:PAS domain-containing protein
MDGIELLEAIREDRPDPPFILFMGRESEETAARAIEAGVDGYQQKRLGRDQHADPGNHIRNSVAKYLESVRADRFREEYVLAAETASDAFWVCDPSTGAMRLNGLHHFGYDSERVDPDFDWWIDAIRADDRDRIRRFTDSLLEGDGPAFDELTADRSQSSIEYRLQFGRGVRRLLRPRDTPVR